MHKKNKNELSVIDLMIISCEIAISVFEIIAFLASSACENSCIIVPTFDMKVTEYLCSGGFFFFRHFDFVTSHF